MTKNEPAGERWPLRDANVRIAGEELEDQGRGGRVLGEVVADESDGALPRPQVRIALDGEAVGGALRQAVDEHGLEELLVVVRHRGTACPALVAHLDRQVEA